MADSPQSFDLLGLLVSKSVLTSGDANTLLPAIDTSSIPSSFTVLGYTVTAATLAARDASIFSVNTGDGNTISISIPYATMYANQSALYVAVQGAIRTQLVRYFRGEYVAQGGPDGGSSPHPGSPGHTIVPRL